MKMTPYYMFKKTTISTKRSNAMLLSLLLVGAGFAAAACGDIDVRGPKTAVKSEQTLLNAPLDDLHPAAVGVCTGVINTDPARGEVGACRGGTARCSGTLIAPNLVLTSRHCLVGQNDGPAIDSNPCDADFNTAPIKAGGTHVTTSPSVFVGAPKWYEAAQILVPEGTRLCESDIALIVLSSNVPSSDRKSVV